MIDEKNCYVLGKLQNCRQLHTREYGNEYRKIVKPVLTTWSQGKPCLEYLSQTGGRLYRLSTPHEDIEVEVEELVSTTEDEDGEEITHKIIFFHPKFLPEFEIKKGNFFRYCMLVKIFKDQKMAEVSDLNKYYPCFEPKSLKYGRTMMRGVLFFLDKYQDRLGINTVELQDESSHWCNNDPKFSIRLIYSRQLFGDWPYYWQFGFRPVSPVVTDRIQLNRLKMLSLTLDSHIKGQKILDYIHKHLELSSELWDKISKECNSRPDDSRLSDLLRWLSMEVCMVFFYLYEDLYRDLELMDPYKRQENRWILNL